MFWSRTFTKAARGVAVPGIKLYPLRGTASPLFFARFLPEEFAVESPVVDSLGHVRLGTKSALATFGPIKTGMCLLVTSSPGDWNGHNDNSSSLTVDVGFLECKVITAALPFEPKFITAL